MSFQPTPFADLFAQMRERSGQLTDFEVGSVTRTLTESFAYELASLHQKLFGVYLSGFVDTAEGRQLDQVVAILGIQRTLPEYATGIVTFKRDTGNQEIIIPLGTMVATEDKPEDPKRAYVTIDKAKLEPNQAETSIRVRAFERGKEQITEARSISVMPRPLAGVKEVVNHEKIRFLGKNRETDDELRRRAKIALLAAGKAVAPAIEQGLLSKSGIKEAVVKEFFHHARGHIDLAYNGTSAFVLPKGSLIRTVGVANGNPLIKDTNTSLEILEEIRWDVVTDGNQTEATWKENIPVRAIHSKVNVETENLLHYPSDYNAYWQMVDQDLNANIDINFKGEQFITKDQYGTIRVFVDDTLTEIDPATRRTELLDEIAKWRAAGVYVYLHPIANINCGGIFRIELDPSINLTSEERRNFEIEVEDRIRTFLRGRRTGESLPFPTLFKQMLEVDNVQNVANLRILTERLATETPSRSQENNIYRIVSGEVVIGEESRLDPGAENSTVQPQYISVASEQKELPFFLEFYAPDIDDDSVKEYTKRALDYLNGTAYPKHRITKLRESIFANNNAWPTFPFQISAVPWSSRPVMDGDFIDISFTETASIGQIFAYDTYLALIGGMQIEFVGTMAPTEKTSALERIEADLSAYLSLLGPEQNIEFSALELVAYQSPGVINVTIEPDDWRVGKLEVLDEEPIVILGTPITVLSSTGSYSYINAKKKIDEVAVPIELKKTAAPTIFKSQEKRTKDASGFIRQLANTQVGAKKTDLKLVDQRLNLNLLTGENVQLLDSKANVPLNQYKADEKNFTHLPERLDKKKRIIHVEKYEKPLWYRLLVTEKPVVLKAKFEPIEVRIWMTGLSFDEVTNIGIKIRETIITSFKEIKLQKGQNFSITPIQNAINQLIRTNANWLTEIENLSLNTSQKDNRKQNANLTNQEEIHVRSPEIPQIKILTNSDIIIEFPNYTAN